MEEIGTNCIDLLSHNNNVYEKILEEFRLKRSHNCKKNAANAYIIATKLLEKTKNKI